MLVDSLPVVADAPQAMSSDDLRWLRAFSREADLPCQDLSGDGSRLGTR